MVKYKSLATTILKQINRGKYEEGGRLPSIRTLAETHSCNKSTVISAFNHLRQEGYVYSIQGSGYYVMPLTKNSSKDIDFTMVRPESRLIPYKEFNNCINKAMDYYKDELFAYGPPQGLIGLRQAIIKDLEHNQVFSSLDNLCITNGAQQGIDLVLALMKDLGKNKLLVEEPTYSMIYEMARKRGFQIYTIPRDREGIDTYRLKRLFSEESIDLFYINPRLQNPLGMSHVERTKKRILELAEIYDVKILEDDCLVDLDVNTRYLPLYHYDTMDNVIYLKSYSKCFVPGLRVGVVVLPNSMTTGFINLKKLTDLGSSILNQGALEYFITSGLYSRHRDKLQAIYSKKMRLAKELISTAGKGLLECYSESKGIFLWIRVTKDVSIDKLIEGLKDKNIYVNDGREYFINNNHDRFLRLCIYNLSDEMIRDGIVAIVKIIEEMTTF